MEQIAKCPRCGAQMSYRLGDFECRECGLQQAGRVDDEPQFHGPGLKIAPPSPPPAPPERRTYLGQPRPDIRTAPPERYDPAPTLSKEKYYLFAVFLVKAAVNIAAAAAAPLDPNAVGAASPIGSQIGVELVAFGLIALAIYLPFIPLKWACATYTCFMAMLAVAGLFLSAVLLPLVSFVLPNLPGLPIATGWLIALLNTLVQLWLASVLYRDIQKMQAE